ncbi:MAG: hypothetical protein IT424_12415 [Pirellulales bacterium]|nr:hypothetical protein [Pirellulales bacterium]
MKLRLLLGAALIASGLAAQVRGAGVILDTFGFEGFVDGALQGQQGWVTAGSGSTATVQSSLSQAGAKAVEMHRAAGAAGRWAKPVSGYPTGRFVILDWNMRVEPTGAPSGVFGPFFGVEAYDGASGIRLLGSLGVDATTGEVLYQIQDDGFLTPTGATAAPNEWNRYRIVLDFAADQYSMFFNGDKVASTGFVDRAFGLDDFTDADLATFAAGFDTASLAQAGTAQFDNFLAWESLPGDFNLDGAVNGSDLAIWRGQAGIGAGGDADADGDSDGADFLLWQRNAGANVLTATAAAAAVPEPASAVLALVAVAALRRRAKGM